MTSWNEGLIYLSCKEYTEKTTYPTRKATSSVQKATSSVQKSEQKSISEIGGFKQILRIKKESCSNFFLNWNSYKYLCKTGNWQQLKL